MIEFVQKSDPTVQQMLRLREDIFDEYDEGTFRAALGSNARTVEVAAVSATERRLYAYARH